ncbi:MAG TPA: lipopolysaccharide biosynthesis protein [Elusimicrobiota bacterium]|nr:lipopolysaccharide biosynthesis protein [Elusimicrobiota bacterium]
MSRGRRFARNVSWSLAGQAGTILVNFFTLPYLLRGFGTEAYGVYLLMYTVANYLSLFQFSAGTATVKYVAEAQAAGEDGALRDALRHSFWIHFLGVGAASAALWLAAGPLSRSTFDIPDYYRVHAFWLLRAAALGGLFAAGAQWASAAFWGLQRLAAPSALALLQSILMPLGLVAVLAMGRGLGAAAAWYVVVQASGFLFLGLALRAAMARHRGTKGRLAFKPFFRYGLTFMPGVLANLVSSQLDKIFVAGKLSMSELTYYSVPSGVLDRLQTPSAMISTALMPVLSEVGRVEGKEHLARVYVRSVRALFALLAPALGLLFVLMPQLLGLWINPAFGKSAEVAARLLVVEQTFAIVFLGPKAAAGGLDGGHYNSVAMWGQALICLALWPFLIPRWGIAGAAAGALVAQAAATLYFLDATHRHLIQLSWGRFLREIAGPLVPPTGALVLVAWLLRGWAWTWPGFLAVNAAAGLAYLGLAWRALPEEDTRGVIRWFAKA